MLKALAIAGGLGLCAFGVMAQAPAEAPAKPPPAAGAYISRFCAPIAMSDPDVGALRQHYADWGARVASNDEAQAARPDDIEAPGQMVTFTDKAAPHVFVDFRHSMCSVVYPDAHTPDAVIEAFKTDVLPVRQGKSTPWRRITTKRVGPPGPIRYFLPASEDGRFGLCATLFEDLRLHDATPATVVRVEACRMRGDETFDNG